MSTESLSRLNRVELRRAWSNESLEFTPWLARPENLALLGEAIGIELELVQTEMAVGSFSADIVCKETSKGTQVLIENQIERTDHTHLGQLLTYAAGLEAVVIVWVAREFTDPHRAALDWLNEVTDDRARFFGLEIELWQIADSPYAPKFNVVARPNEWTETVQETAGKNLSAWQELQVAFWSGYREHLKEHGVTSPPKALPQSWVNHPLGRTGYTLASIISSWDFVRNVSGQQLRVELAVYPDDSATAFAKLLERIDEIGAQIGEPLEVSNPEDIKTKKLFVSLDVDLDDRSRWPEYYEWLWGHVHRFDRVFRPLVRDL